MVYIQYRQATQKPLAESLQDTCEQKGWTAPGVELVEQDFSGSVRYFNSKDRAFAEKVLKTTEAFLQEQGQPANLKLLDLPNSRLQAPLGQVEVWLSL